MPRSVEQLVDEQVRRGQLQRPEEKGLPAGPVVTVSRKHGAGGGELARRAAAQLGYAFFDDEIIRQISESAHLSERVVRSLDDADRDAVTDWLAPFATDPYLSPAGYLQHLQHVVGAIARHGNAVILGRGAHLLLGPGRALRVLVTAPLPVRLAETARREGLAPRDARQRIEAIDGSRRSFLVKHFHVDPDDPSAFDVVINTALLGIEGAIQTVHAAVVAFRGTRPRPAAVAGL